MRTTPYALAKTCDPQDSEAIAILLDHSRKLEQVIDAGCGALAALNRAPAPAFLDYPYGR